MQTVFYTTIIAVINTTQYLIYDKVTYKQKLKTNQIQLKQVYTICETLWMHI